MNRLVRFLIADCPWLFNNRHETRRDNKEKKSKFGIGVTGDRYSSGCMKTADLCSLEPLITPIVAPDAYLGLWAVCSMLPDALKVMDAWGFQYKTVLNVWRKLNCRSLTDFSGPGRYSPSNVELLLLGTRGKKCWHPNWGKKVNQIFSSPHPRHKVMSDKGKLVERIHHSRKPLPIQENIYNWLSPHIGDHSFLELFATEEKENWQTMGHAISGLDIRVELDTYKKNLYLT